MIKITLIGDVMMEPLLINSSFKNGKYDFSNVFKDVKHIYENSDYTIANFEAPLAGEYMLYTHELLSFNSPVEFAKDLMNSGVDALTLANNHILDRGIEGAYNTIKNLEQNNIPYTGINSSKENRKEALYFNIDDTKFALIAYTYGTNYYSNKIKLEDEEYLVNLLRPQEEFYHIPEKRNAPFFEKVVRKLLSYVKEEKKFKVLKMLKLPHNWAREDNNLKKDTAEKYIKQMKKDIEIAKSKSDFVIFYPHVGGQFNPNPGIFTQYVFEQAKEAGADLILASHPHVVQKFSYIDDIPCFYSLGNFNMSPNSLYLIFEDLPQFGIIPHIYIEDKKINKISFSIIKTIENKKEQMKVYDTKYLYDNSNSKEQNELNKNIATIYEKVSGKKYDGTPLEEYILYKGLNNGK